MLLLLCNVLAIYIAIHPPPSLRFEDGGLLADCLIKLEKNYVSGN